MTDELNTNDPTRVPVERTDDTALPDDTIVDDDLAPTGQDAPAGAQTRGPDWDRREWAGDNQHHRADVDEDAISSAEAPDTGFPKWNEHQVVGEGQGGPDEGPDARVVPTEGSSEYSGHGHNPGGGERWAEGNVERERRD